MPELRPINVYDHGVLVGVDGYEQVSDEQLRQEEINRQMNDAHTAARAALANWANLTLAQKDSILKNLVRWALWKDGFL